MFTLFQQLLPVSIALTASMGVLFHGVHIDQVATLAIPIPFSTTYSSDFPLKANDQHTHTERVSIGRSVLRTTAQPTIGPRIGEDKKYITSKKLGTTSSNDYSWPVV